MPENLFQPHTHAKTCVVLMTKFDTPDQTVAKDHKIFVFANSCSQWPSPALPAIGVSCIHPRAYEAYRPPHRVSGYFRITAEGYLLFSNLPNIFFE